LLCLSLGLGDSSEALTLFFLLFHFFLGNTLSLSLQRLLLCLISLFLSLKSLGLDLSNLFLSSSCVEFGFFQSLLSNFFENDFRDSFFIGRLFLILSDKVTNRSG